MRMRQFAAATPVRARLQLPDFLPLTMDGQLHMGEDARALTTRKMLKPYNVVVDCCETKLAPSTACFYLTCHLMSRCPKLICALPP